MHPHTSVSFIRYDTNFVFLKNCITVTFLQVCVLPAPLCLSRGKADEKCLGCRCGRCGLGTQALGVCSSFIAPASHSHSVITNAEYSFVLTYGQSKWKVAYSLGTSMFFFYVILNIVFFSDSRCFMEWAGEEKYYLQIKICKFLLQLLQTCTSASS